LGAFLQFTAIRGSEVRPARRVEEVTAHFRIGIIDFATKITLFFLLWWMGVFAGVFGKT
jgi:hypothetical protein